MNLIVYYITVDACCDVKYVDLNVRSVIIFAVGDNNLKNRKQKKEKEKNMWRQ